MGSPVCRVGDLGSDNSQYQKFLNKVGSLCNEPPRDKIWEKKFLTKLRKLVDDFFFFFMSKVGIATKLCINFPTWKMAVLILI